MEQTTAIDPMKDKQGYFSEDQLKSFFEVITSIRDKLIFRLLYKSGRRISELTAVKIKDIDFNLAMINWNILKKRNHLKRLKPIDSKTMELIKEYIQLYQLQPDNYLFPSPKKIYKDKETNEKRILESKPLSRVRIFQLMRDYCNKIGIDKIGEKKPHPHHLRHTLAVRMAVKMKSPADMRKLQMLLEHSTLGITEAYLQFRQEEIRELMEEENI